MRKTIASITSAAVLLAVSCSGGPFQDLPVVIPHEESRQMILIPEPQEYVASPDDDFILPEECVISVSDERALHGAEILAEELHDYRGIHAAIGDGGVITLSVDSEICDNREESYILTVTPQGVTLTGHDSRGLINGAMTLAQMAKKNPEDRSIRIPSATIRDWPELSMRGYFFELNAKDVWGGQDTFHWLKRCVSRLSAYYKANMVGLGEAGSGCFPLKKYPFLHFERGLTEEQIRELVALARHYEMEPYPVIQIFGHSDGNLLLRPKGESDLTYGPDGVASFAERMADGRRGNAMCPLHPQTKKVASDIIKSVCELFDTPKYVHIGMDEVVPVGTCPECRKHDASQLVGDYITWCYEQVKAQGVETVIMWNDILLDAQEFPEGPAFSNIQAEINFFGVPTRFDHITHHAVDMIPRDIMIAFYNYGGVGVKGLHFFKEKGFPVIGASWMGDDLAFRVGRRMVAEGLPGFIATAWTFTYWRGGMTLASSEAAWSPSKAIRDFDRETRLHLDMLPPRPSEFAGTYTTPLDLIGNAERDKVFAAANIDTRPDRIGGFPEGELKIGNVLYRIDNKVLGVSGIQNQEKFGLPGEAVLEIGRPVEGVALLLGGVKCPILSFEEVGVMTAVYEDGTWMDIPICSGTHLGMIQHHNPGDPMAHPAMKWMTDTRLYELRSPWNWALRLQSWEWQNPYPEKVLTGLEWRPADGRVEDAFVIFAASAIEK